MTAWEIIQKNEKEMLILDLTFGGIYQKREPVEEKTNLDKIFNGLPTKWAIFPKNHVLSRLGKDGLRVIYSDDGYFMAEEIDGEYDNETLFTAIKYLIELEKIDKGLVKGLVKDFYMYTLKVDVDEWLETHMDKSKEFDYKKYLLICELEDK